MNPRPTEGNLLRTMRSRQGYFFYRFQWCVSQKSEMGVCHIEVCRADQGFLLVDFSWPHIARLPLSLCYVEKSFDFEAGVFVIF